MLYVNGIHEKLMWEYVFPDEIIEEQEYSIAYFMEPLMNHKAFDTTELQAFQTTSPSFLSVDTCILLSLIDLVSVLLSMSLALLPLLSAL